MEKINNLPKKRLRVLIAPLDWGLGHTTRCLPIIKAFQQAGAEIVVACNDQQSYLLKAEIPLIQLVFLKGYNFRYSTTKWLTRLRLVAQIPKILTAIKQERRWLSTLLEKENFDVIVSDNRYGLHHSSAHCIFITHQCRIRIPFSKWMEDKIQHLNYQFINRFDECWIPDFEDEPQLAGMLSHPQKLPNLKVKYIGCLSRFHIEGNSETNYPDLIVLISGPEPQRSIFEDMIIKNLEQFEGTAVVIRGLPHATEKKEGFNDITFFNHLPTSQLNILLGNAKFVISRAGYSTIMDMIALRKKSILIPTPGQTEQEYLAQTLMNKKYFLSFQQNKFSLQHALKAAEQFEYADLFKIQTNQIDGIVSEFMHVNTVYEKSEE